MPNPSLPLPDDLVQVIEAYLEKHNDDGPSERLQEELLGIWDKTVKDVSTAHAAWLAILRQLLPALNDCSYIIEWWDRVQEPVLNHLIEDRTLRSEAWANTLAVLTNDYIADSDGSQLLATRLLQIWMHNAQLGNQGNNTQAINKAKLVRGGLLSYGRKKPKVS